MTADGSDHWSEDEAEKLARPHSTDCFLSKPLDVYWHDGVPILRENFGTRKGCDCGRDEEVQRIAAKLAGADEGTDIVEGDLVEILSYGTVRHRGTVLSHNWEGDVWFRSRSGTVVIAPYDTETLTVDVRNLGPRQFYRRASPCTQTQDWRSGTPNQSRIADFTIRHEQRATP